MDDQTRVLPSPFRRGSAPVPEIMSNEETRFLLILIHKYVGYLYTADDILRTRLGKALIRKAGALRSIEAQLWEWNGEAFQQFQALRAALQCPPGAGVIDPDPTYPDRTLLAGQIDQALATRATLIQGLQELDTQLRAV